MPMTDTKQQNDKPLRYRPIMATAGVLIGIGIMVVVLAIVVIGVQRIREQPAADAPDAKSPAELLTEKQQADREQLTTYGWVDRDKGVVRVPIDAAIEKLIEHRAGTATQPARSPDE
jgi:hypothetical protein